MATDLILIRHAESVPNVQPVIGGMRGDSGLTARGREQAALLEARLRAEHRHADALYASTLPRALETAAYVGRALGLAVTPDDELHELRPGAADGLSVTEWRERYPRPGGRVFEDDFFDPRGPGYPTHLFAPGGESWTTFLTRTGAALVRLVERHPDQTVVVVTHGGNLRALFFVAFGLAAAGNGIRFEPTNTGISHWRHHPALDGSGAWVILSFNDAAHLQAWAGSLRDRSRYP